MRAASPQGSETPSQPENPPAFPAALCASPLIRQPPGGVCHLPPREGSRRGGDEGREMIQAARRHAASGFPWGKLSAKLTDEGRFPAGKRNPVAAGDLPAFPATLCASPLIRQPPVGVFHLPPREGSPRGGDEGREMIQAAQRRITSGFPNGEGISDEVSARPARRRNQNASERSVCVLERTFRRNLRAIALARLRTIPPNKDARPFVDFVPPGKYNDA